MKQTIKKALYLIEQRFNIKILLAIESGSRAWNMHSEDSDYDVRFVYCRQPYSYLKLDPPTDVIEIKSGDIDVVGFDIYKFTKLLRKSNPSMIEWLVASEMGHEYIISQIKGIHKIGLTQFNPIALFYHYKSLAKQNYQKYIKNEKQVSIKKYLYVLRGIINSKIVAETNQIPNIDFIQTVKSYKEHTKDKEFIKVLDKVEQFVVMKQTSEQNTIKKDAKLNKFIEEYLKTAEYTTSRSPMDTKALDAEIMSIIYNAWKEPKQKTMP